MGMRKTKLPKRFFIKSTTQNKYYELKTNKLIKSNLRHIDLSYNQISEEGFKDFISNINRSNKLKLLSLFGNTVKDIKEEMKEDLRQRKVKLYINDKVLTAHFHLQRMK